MVCVVLSLGRARLSRVVAGSVQTLRVLLNRFEEHVFHYFPRLATEHLWQRDLFDGAVLGVRGCCMDRRHLHLFLSGLVKFLRRLSYQ